MVTPCYTQLDMRNLYEEARLLTQHPVDDPDPTGLPSPGVISNRIDTRPEIKALTNLRHVAEHDRPGCLMIMAILIKLTKDDVDHVQRLDPRLRDGYITHMRAIENTEHSPELRAAARAIRQELERTS